MSDSNLHPVMQGVFAPHMVEVDQGDSQSLPGYGECALASAGAEPSAAFTPGPWEVWKRYDDRIIPAGQGGLKCGFASNPEVDRREYAHVIALPCGDRHGRGSREANARLISAAPDLLHELLALVTAVTYTAPPKEFGTPDDPNPCFEARVPVEFVERARTAIAKATGAA